MKQLILILTFLFPVSSFADWAEVVTTGDGTTYYLDVETIKERNGLVYYWILIEYSKPSSTGVLSAKRLWELNCNAPRKQRIISFSYYSTQLGTGTPLVTYNEEKQWMSSQLHPVQKSTMEEVCGLNDLYKRDIKGYIK
ncbi:hypothetical protein N9A26_00115 [bacterium]|nr:hypothetical protein [bacterium]